MTQDTPAIQTSAAINEQHLLPSDITLALKALIKTTETLVGLSERESHAMATNDMISFAILQDEKSIQTDRYVRLSQEFRSRLEDFRKADKTLLDRLEKLQKTLGENTQYNNHLIKQIQKKARAKTENTLLSAQELGQKHPVNFATGSGQ